MNDGNEIVSFSIAKQLKELHFDWGVNWFYHSTGIICNIVEGSKVTNNTLNVYEYAAPTKKEAAEWLLITAKKQADSFNKLQEMLIGSKSEKKD